MKSVHEAPWTEFRYREPLYTFLKDKGPGGNDFSPTCLCTPEQGQAQRTAVAAAGWGAGLLTGDRSDPKAGY